MSQQAITVMSARPLMIDLKSEIEAIISQHNSCSHKPPFSPAELSVMAWVCCRDLHGTITNREIFVWITTELDYYAACAVQDAYKLSVHSGRGTPKSRLQALSRGILDDTSLHEVPMFLVAPNNSSQISLIVSDTAIRRYTSTLASARLFLRRALGDEPKGFSRLLDLPVEIRLMIYAEVFRYNGKLQFLNPKLTASAPRRILRSQSYQQQAMVDRAAQGHTHPNWKISERRQGVTGLSGEIMSLLLVNRQIFNEAMPVFYQVNAFRVDSVHGLVRMLRRCGERRRKYFSHIEIGSRYDVSTGTCAAAVKLLSQTKQLRRLVLQESDSDMTNFKTFEDLRKYWLDPLSNLRVTIMEFPRSAPKAEAYVREKQAQLLHEDEQVATKRGAKSAAPRERLKKTRKGKVASLS